MGIGEDTRERQEADVKEKIRKSLERHFRPEFLNRLDEIIIFSSLSPEVIKKVVDLQLEKVEKRIEGRGIKMIFTDNVKKFIAEKGHDPQWGARPLKRTIQNLILDPLAQEIIAGRIGEGDSVLADIQDDNISFAKNLKRVVDREKVDGVKAR